jgi:hypothetical protein
MSAHFAKHRIPDEMVRSAGFKWLTPWVLWDVRRLSRPIPYDHPKGAVVWVNLSADEEAAVLGAGAGGPSFVEDTTVTADNRRLANQTVAQIAQDGGFSIPPDASTSIRREGSKLYIDVEWDDDGPSQRRSRWADMRNLLGVFGVAATVFCYFAFLAHVWLAMISSFTLVGAFKWLIAAFAAMLVALIGGRGEDIGQIFGER